MKKTIYETNYQRVVAMGIYNETGKQCPYMRSRAAGFMDVIVERLEHLDNSRNNPGVAFSMAHYYEQNGDLMADPEMTFIVYPEFKTLEALTFQMAHPPIYQEIYPEPGMVAPKLKTELNHFLAGWLKNLDLQGHGRVWTGE